MLCSNRFPLSGSPSTCILDTVIVPLPSFMLLAGLGGVYLLQLKCDKLRVVCPPRWLHIAYTVLVFLTFGMTILEIARLIAEQAGVGLLPVTSIALSFIVFVLVLQRNERTQAVSLLFFMYWTGSIVLLAVKVSRLHLLEVVYPNKHSKYPSSDKFLDNAVILGLYVVFTIIEGVILVLLRKHGLDTNPRKLQAV